MLLGAQLYSLRDKTQSLESYAECFAKVKEMGYEAVQVSGGMACDPYFLADLSKKNAILIPTTHSPLDRIMNDTDRLIEEHKIFGADEIGLGGLPPLFRETKEDVYAFLKGMEEPVRKIKAAGLRFAYHNHNFEFFPLGDTCLMEILFQDTDWYFIPDVYWMTNAGQDPVALLERMRGRTVNIHLKDMAKDGSRGITACGTGLIDFAPIIKKAEEIGVFAAFVEQDNAPDFGSYEQMKIAADLMLPQVHHN